MLGMHPRSEKRTMPHHVATHSMAPVKAVYQIPCWHDTARHTRCQHQGRAQHAADMASLPRIAWRAQKRLIAKGMRHVLVHDHH